MSRVSEVVEDALRPLGTLPDWLVAAGDPAAVGAALVRYVPEFAAGDLTLRECWVERMRLKRGSHTTTYRVAVEGRSGGERVVELRGDIIAAGTSAAARGPRGVPFGAYGWGCYLPELRVRLSTASVEPALPALPVLTDPAQARDFLEEAIRACSPTHANLRIEAAQPQVVRAKGSRCTVLYELEFAAGLGGPSPVIAKTYRGDKGENAYVGMRALWTSKLGTSTVVAIAEPLAFVSDLNVLVQGPVREETTLKALARSAFAVGTPRALAGLSAYVDKAAAGLAELHTSRVTYGDVAAWDDKLADVEEIVGRLESFAPQLAHTAAPLLRRLEQRAAEHEPDPPVPTHGSFRPNQVLVNAGDVGFIDFDRFGQAEPSVDIASFRTALRDAGRLDNAGEGSSALRTRLARLDELCERFLTVYASHAPVSSKRVEVWETLGLFTTVLHCWTKLESGLEARLELLRHHLRRGGLAL